MEYFIYFDLYEKFRCIYKGRLKYDEFVVINNLPFKDENFKILIKVNEDLILERYYRIEKFKGCMYVNGDRVFGKYVLIMPDLEINIHDIK